MDRISSTNMQHSSSHFLAVHCNWKSNVQHTKRGCGGRGQRAQMREWSMAGPIALLVEGKDHTQDQKWKEKQHTLRILEEYSMLPQAAHMCYGILSVKLSLKLSTSNSSSHTTLYRLPQTLPLILSIIMCILSIIMWSTSCCVALCSFLVLLAGGGHRDACCSTAACGCCVVLRLLASLVVLVCCVLPPVWSNPTKYIQNRTVHTNSCYYPGQAAPSLGDFASKPNLSKQKHPWCWLPGSCGRCCFLCPLKIICWHSTTIWPGATRHRLL